MALNCDLSFAGVGDQLEGDPAGIRDGAADMHRAGENLGNAARAVNKLVSSSDEIVSKAFDAIGEKAGIATSKLSDAGHRYRRIAEELNGFAAVLETEQANARRHAETAQEAKGRMDRAEAAYNKARVKAMTVDQDAQNSAVADAEQASSHFDSANADYSQAISSIQAAASRVAEANNKAASAIESISNVSGLEDSFLDRLCAAVKAVVDTIVKIGKWIWDNIDTICLVLDIVSLVLMCIPGVNAAVGALKLIVTAVNFLSKAAKAIQTTKDVVETGSAVVKAIQDPSAENVGNVVKMVGTQLLDKYVGDNVRNGMEGYIDDAGDAIQDEFLRGFDKVFPNVKPNTREFAEDLVEEGSEMWMRNRLDYRLEQSYEQAMDDLIPTEESQNEKEAVGASVPGALGSGVGR